MSLYKEVQQDKTAGTDSVYVCHYEVSNEIICPKNACPINCADPLNCYGNGAEIPDPTFQAIFRPISNDKINPNNRILGPNWSNEKGLATKARIEDKGENIYAEDSLYSFTLDTNLILEIRKYNDSTTYADFEMTCSQDGDQCRSKFVQDYAIAISQDWVEYDAKTKTFINKK